MVDVTLLEVRLDGSTLTANAPFSGTEEEPDGEAAEESEAGVRSRLLPVVVGLVFLAVVAYLARRRLAGGGGEETEPPVAAGTGTDTEVPAEP